MANSSTKKIVTSNEKLLALLWKIYYSISVVYALYTVYAFTRHSSLNTTGTNISTLLWIWVITAALGLWLLRLLTSMGSGVQNPVSGELNVQIDLGAKGLHQYMLDVLYITFVIQLLCLVMTTKAIYLYLVAPMYGMYQLASRFLLPYLRSSSTRSTDEVTSPTGKTKEKKQKTKYVRG